MVIVSVIGCGNMGGALVRGLSRSGNHEIIACDLDPEALAAVEQYATRTTQDPADAAEAEVVFLAVKPQYVSEALDSLDLPADRTLVTIAAGVSIEFVAARTDANVVRLMPNLAAETRDMAGAVAGEAIPDEVLALLDEVGEYVQIDESLMDTATALNGSSPAFVFYLIRALREGAVDEGMEAEQAEVLAAQTFKGAAETVLRDDRSIGELIDAVCSPGGTTIEGMRVLRDSDVERDVGAALSAAAERSRELAAEAGE